MTGSPLELEDVDFESFLNDLPDFWVGFAVNFKKNRRKLVKVWRNLPKEGNYRSDEILNLESLVVFKPGRWQNSTSAPGCPILKSPEEYNEWYLVVVKSRPFFS